VPPETNSSERRPPARRGAAAILERAAPEAGAPVHGSFDGSATAHRDHEPLPKVSQRFG